MLTVRQWRIVCVAKGGEGGQVASPLERYVGGSVSQTELNIHCWSDYTTVLSSSVQNSEGGSDSDSGDRCADPLQEFKKVFLGFLVVPPLFTHFLRICLKIWECDVTQKN